MTARGAITDFANANTIAASRVRLSEQQLTESGCKAMLMAAAVVCREGETDMRSRPVIVGASVALIALVGSAVQTRADVVLDQSFVLPVTNNNSVGFSAVDPSVFRRAQTFTVGLAGTLSEVDVLISGVPSFSGLNILSTTAGVPTTTVLGTGYFVGRPNDGIAVFSTSLPVTVGEVLRSNPLALLVGVAG
jgi:hypothetical protein